MATKKKAPGLPEPKGLRLYDHKAQAEEGFARVLILGPAKGGKSTCVAKTAPGPVLMINCDGVDALMGATNQGAVFNAVDAVGRKSWKAACDYAYDCAEQGLIKTICVDTVTLLVDTLVDELKTQGVEGWDIWTTSHDDVMHGMAKLMRAEAHLFINAHMYAGDTQAEGILPAIAGKRLRTFLPGKVQDWVLFQVDTEKKEAVRQFVLGPQKAWTHSGRNIKRSCVIEADCMDLLDELGIQP